VKYFILALILISFIAGCKTESDCLNLSGNTGLIISEHDMGKCYSYLEGNKYLIKDSTSYKNLSLDAVDSIQTALSCDANPDLPSLDFDTYYLLGAKTESTGCIVTYNRDIGYDNTTNVLHYKIDVYQCGDCGDLRYNMNWVIIRKLNNIDSVNVSINYIKESN
jgi:hypothetical protein